jgi:hypothetical protein
VSFSDVDLSSTHCPAVPANEKTIGAADEVMPFCGLPSVAAIDRRLDGSHLAAAHQDFARFVARRHRDQILPGGRGEEAQPLAILGGGQTAALGEDLARLGRKDIALRVAQLDALDRGRLVGILVFIIAALPRPWA